LPPFAKRIEVLPELEVAERRGVLLWFAVEDASGRECWFPVVSGATSVPSFCGREEDENEVILGERI